MELTHECIIGRGFEGRNQGQSMLVPPSTDGRRGTDAGGENRQLSNGKDASNGNTTVDKPIARAFTTNPDQACSDETAAN